MARRAFTLVELLVVIAIIGIMIGMLLPAMQATRENARRVRCVSRMHDLSIAMARYASANEVLPPGTTNPTGPIANTPEGQHRGWLIELLPYVDEPTAYKRIDKDSSVYAVENNNVRQHRVTAFTCPSEDSGDSAPIVSSYAGSHHDVEAPIDTDNHGVLFLNSKIAYSDIHDGRAYTIMVGEKIRDADDLGWMSGTRATLRNAGHPLNQTGLRSAARDIAIDVEDGEVENAQVDGDVQQIRPPHYVGGFGSHHATVVNFIFADNSVQSVSKLIDRAVLAHLSHRADGELINWPPDE